MDLEESRPSDATAIYAEFMIETAEGPQVLVPLVLMRPSYLVLHFPHTREHKRSSSPYKPVELDSLRCRRRAWRIS